MTGSLSYEQQRAVAASFPREDRRTRVRRAMDRLGLDAVVAVGSRYATWLTGYHRYSGGPTAALIGPTDGVELVVSAEEARIVERTSAPARIHSYGERGFGLDLDPLPALLGALSRLDRFSRHARIGVAGLLPAALECAVTGELVPIDAQLAAVMTVKDRDEAEKIAASYNLCLAAQSAVEEEVAEGASELEMFTRAHAVAQLAAGEPVEFLSDLLSGPNSAEISGPVVVAGPRRPAEAEPVIADILVRAAGYWGDTCRTHVRGGRGEFESLLATLASVLDESVAGLRPGVRACDVFAAMARRLREAFRDSIDLPHHGGHGLGLEPAEGPNLAPRDDTPLEAGMILAIEPGAYFPGRFGMRLENEYLVTPLGGVELNTAMETLTAGATQ